MKYIISTLLLFLLVACPKPNEKLDPAICDEGYHPCGPDSQECCLDTTSHSVTWTIDTIGIAGTTLYDIAVIDEEDIWVVGEIVVDEIDSLTGNPFSIYNAAHWNGLKWELIHVPALTSWGTITRAAIFTVFKVGENDLVMFSESGSYVQLVNGIWYSEYVEERPHGINACWGTDISNMYFAGRNYTGTPGGIVHYDGSSFTLQAETDFPLHDVYGIDENHIWAGGYTNSVPGTGGILIEYENGSWDTKYSVTSGQDSLGYVNNVYAVDDTLYVTTSKGLWREHIDTGAGYLTPRSEIGSYWSVHRIRGTAANDILLSNDDCKFFHWNGSTWEMILDARSRFGGETFFMADFYISDDRIILPGVIQAGGIVFRGERN